MRFASAFAALIVLAQPAIGQDSVMTNSVGMEFILVQSGTMQVGVFQPACPRPASSGQQGGWSEQDIARCEAMIATDRSEGFPVEISQAFYLGRYEVTQAQWVMVMGTNPATFRSGDGPMDDHPVESITWAQAQAFVSALNAREGTDAYRLPSEFEWEYACRAGGPGQQTWSAVREMAVDGGESLGFGYGRTPRDANLPPPTTSPVGTKQANAWGFYDMLGNVWEWTTDPYNGRTFADPQPAVGASTHVLKGGSFVSDVKNAICATHGGGPGNGWDVGLRVVRSVSPAQ